MVRPESEAFDRVLDAIMLCGLLVETHPMLPSVAGLVIGEDGIDDWRAHPAAAEVGAVIDRLAEHEDVIATPLVAGRRTWIHRQLWPSLLAVVTRREAWQVNGLSAEAAHLLEIVDAHGETPPEEETAHHAAARELVDRLLAHEAGGHLESWSAWCRRRRVPMPEMSAASGRLTLEETVMSLNRGVCGAARLPWAPG